MSTLNDTQLHCLRHLAHAGGGATLPCSTAILDQLHQRGLVEPVMQGALPLENPHSHYRVTAAGKSLLERLTRG